MCDEISAALRSKKNLLLRAMELHHALEKVGVWVKLHLQFIISFFQQINSSLPQKKTPPVQASQWCEEGIFLLASQPVDRCQSQDGAEAALQELERYLDTAALHTIADRGAICCQYEAVLNTQLRVSRTFLQS